MKNLLTVFAVCLTSWVYAANVQWDCFSADTESDKTGVLFIYNNGMVQPGVFVRSARVGNAVTLSGTDEHMGLVFMGFWVQMSVGDIIDYSTMMARPDFFSATIEYDDVDHGWIEPGMDRRIATEKKPIETSTGSSVYLAVMADLTDWTPDYKDYYFGWMELKVDSKGDVSLVRSAFAIDGSPMIVGGGAIPEPSGAVLVLVGAGLLVLRRGRKEKTSLLKKSL